ncbi:hypothetical protein BGZ67_010298 [Mortierella alpina]|nr:hypothetical protein BGZ67_010298 [Mortierella alpina]
MDMEFVESDDEDESEVVASSSCALRTRAAGRAAASKSAVTARTTSSKTFRLRTTYIRESTSSSPAITPNGSSRLRKHASTAKDEEELSAETKRRNFLERNRVAASKCREKNASMS